jgi:hypothetical protein
MGDPKTRLATKEMEAFVLGKGRCAVVRSGRPRRGTRLRSPHIPHARARPFEDVLRAPVSLGKILIECTEPLAVLGAVSSLSYWGRSTGRKRNQPDRFPSFVAEEAKRGRIGWRRFSEVSGPTTHRALAGLEAKGQCERDAADPKRRPVWHQEAGSSTVIDLRGRLDLGTHTPADFRIWPAQRRLGRT